MVGSRTAVMHVAVVVVGFFVVVIVVVIMAANEDALFCYEV